MERVAATQAIKRIGEMFARASRGEQILITSHGRPYVLMGPPPADLPLTPEDDDSEPPEAG